jgi:hypothetical protein
MFSQLLTRTVILPVAQYSQYYHRLPIQYLLYHLFILSPTSEAEVSAHSTLMQLLLLLANAVSYLPESSHGPSVPYCNCSVGRSGTPLYTLRWPLGVCRNNYILVWHAYPLILQTMCTQEQFQDHVYEKEDR